MYLPYIGITDFTKFEQVDRMLEIFESVSHRYSEYKLHVGVMMSYKTLHGMNTKWSTAFPQKEKIKDIFSLSSSRVYNCLHYADFDHSDGFFQSLSKALSYGGPHLNAVQLDMFWPKPREIRRVMQMHASVEVILQIGTDAFKDADNTPEGVVERLEKYEGIISRVLLDKSMGKGLGMDAVGLIPFVQAIRETFPSLGIGVAGGLGPDTIHLVEPLVEKFPYLSIDAQGRLRSSRSALDPIEWDMAKAYLISALKTMR